MDQFDQVVPRQVFTPYDCQLISVAITVLLFCRVGCLCVTDIIKPSQKIFYCCYPIGHLIMPY